MRTAALRGRRRARRGQFVIVYIMGFFTLFTLAIATLTIGQIMVRRQWAQLVVDSAAYAGAAKEAEALNTMANMTAFEFDMLNTIEDRDREWPPPAGGYKTDYAFECELCYDTPQVCYGNVEDNHDNVKNAVFQVVNAQRELLNITARGSAYDDALDVTDQNLRQLFGDEYTSNSGRFSWPTRMPYALVPLVEQTPYFDETVAWYFWSETMMPWSTIGCGGCITCCPSCLIPCWCCPQCYECAWAISCFERSYRTVDIYGTFGLFGNESNHNTQPRPGGFPRPWSSYHFPEVLKLMHKGSETTFLWWVQVPSTPPILGMDTPLGGGTGATGNVPPITAIARAKPYDGNLGRGEGNTEQPVWPKRKWVPFGVPTRLTWTVDWEMEYPTAATYRVKMASVNPRRSREDDALGGLASIKGQLYYVHHWARRYFLPSQDLGDEIEESVYH